MKDNDLHIDVEALNYLLRGRDIVTYIRRKLAEIADNISEQAVRTGDNVPRHIHKSSLRAGYGYEHYEDDIDTLIAVRDRVATGFVIVNRHAILLEFGWTDMAGTHHPPRAYMRTALRMVADV
ncbi:hypothetical protein [Actinomadura rubrisoli]|uniref:Uncharacterized protein n=1 Tax=Actinomadura rubrisoli TaxID=2530368 RepID=A0A4R5CDY5_9ACTN|nr:hypothetical protein [Actinomadura rubrisoli]TDD97169.1 hypothetical protein E1298_01670 [Actinomadura rubrisoli]